MAAAPFAVQVMRLLGRWALLGMGFSPTCSCCAESPEFQQMEQDILASLRERHGSQGVLGPLLEAQERSDPFARPQGLPDLLRALATLRPEPDDPDFARIAALLEDLAGAVEEAERRFGAPGE